MVKKVVVAKGTRRRQKHTMKVPQVLRTRLTFTYVITKRSCCVGLVNITCKTVIWEALRIGETFPWLLTIPFNVFTYKLTVLNTVEDHIVTVLNSDKISFTTLQLFLIKQWTISTVPSDKFFLMTSPLKRHHLSLVRAATYVIPVHP